MDGGGDWTQRRECVDVVVLRTGRTYLYLEEVLGDAVDLLKALGVR